MYSELTRKANYQELKQLLPLLKLKELRLGQLQKKLVQPTTQAKYLHCYFLLIIRYT